MGLQSQKNPLLVLSVVAEHQTSEDLGLPFQRDIVEKTPLTKGAVSNNCKKLSEAGLVVKDSDGRYKIEQKALLDSFKEFLEPFLVRETSEGVFKDEIEKSNESKTKTSGRIEKIFSELSDCFSSLLLSILADVRIRKTADLREVFHQSSLFILVYGYLLSDLDLPEIGSKKIADLISLSSCLNVNHHQLESFTKELSKNLDFDLLSHLSKLGGPNPKLLKETEAIEVK